MEKEERERDGDEDRIFSVHLLHSVSDTNSL